MEVAFAANDLKLRDPTSASKPQKEEEKAPAQSEELRAKIDIIKAVGITDETAIISALE